MTDFVLRAGNKTAMYEAYAELGVLDKDGNLLTTGKAPDGGSWAIYDQGQRSYKVGVDKDGKPIFTTDQYWSPVRWLSSSPLPALPPETIIVWRSDVDKMDTYPQGVSVFS